MKNSPDDEEEEEAIDQSARPDLSPDDEAALSAAEASSQISNADIEASIRWLDVIEQEEK